MEVKIALAGNPNSGKTTLYNALTGANQFVGNWPGVTVEKKEGSLKIDKNVTLVDLPGIYSLSPYSLEEVVARNFLVNEDVDVILNIVDGTNIERNLYLTTQLLELGIPVVVAVNMMDAVDKSGKKIDPERLAQAFGCEVAPISALKGTGINDAARLAIAAAKKPRIKPKHHFSREVEDALSEIENSITDVPNTQKRFFAIKLFERDEKIKTEIKLDLDIESVIKRTEEKQDDDSESIIANERYNYITSIISSFYENENSGKLSTSDKIDKILTNRWLALPIFAVIMFIIYYITITSVGAVVTEWTEDGVFGDGWHLLGIGSKEYDEEYSDYLVQQSIIDNFEKAAEKNNIPARDAIDLITTIEIEYDDGKIGDLEINYLLYLVALEVEEPDAENFGIWVPGIPILLEDLMESINTAPWLSGLVIHGIVGGVGAVLSFVPQMFVLFFFLALLEGSGYMARIAFIMDKLFRKFGLSGKSFIPILIGTGCSVPGIMASRTIENENDRRMTIITTSFIPCGAKLPVIALISGALFNKAAWVAPVAYFIGIAAVIVSGIILKKTKLFSGNTSPFIMELPPYHMPPLSNLLRSMWDRGWSFIKKAGTVILLSAVVIWFFSNFGIVGGKFTLVDDISDGFLSMIGSGVAWIFAPLGWGDWRSALATITGLVAKENVVGAFGVLYGYAETDTGLWSQLAKAYTPLAGLSFLIFNLLCAPCFAAIGAIKKEMNDGKWTAFAIGYQTLLAYAVAFCVYQIGTLVISSIFNIATFIAFGLIGIFLYFLFRTGDKQKVKKG